MQEQCPHISPLSCVLVDLGGKFQTTRCSEDDDVCAHFSKLAHRHKKLSALGRSVSDDEHVAVLNTDWLLILSLMSRYDGPIDSLTSCDVNNIDITPHRCYPGRHPGA